MTSNIVRHVKFLSQNSRNSSLRRVVVTGLGVVSPLGTGTELVWKNLLKGSCGIVSLTSADYAKLPCRIAGIVPSATDDKVSKAMTKSNLKSMAPATCLALVATEEALLDANWLPEAGMDKEKTGVAIGMGMIDLKDVCDTNDALKLGYNKASADCGHSALPSMMNQPKLPDHLIKTEMGL